MRKNRKNTRKPFQCKSEAQKAAIRRYYAEKQAKERQERVETEYPHFRYYKKANHPALIVGEQTTEEKGEEYKYRKVMHSKRDGGRPNEKVDPNPNPNDPDPMYIGKRVRHDEKQYFGTKPLPWKYPKK